MADLKNDIEKYLRNELTPAERYALELKALSDPFLAEALEGAESIPPPDFSADLEQLEISLRQRLHKKEETPIWMWAARIAAGLLIILIVGYVFYESSNSKDKNGKLALNKTQEMTPVPPSEPEGKSQDSASTVEEPEAAKPSKEKNEAPKIVEQSSKPFISSNDEKEEEPSPEEHPPAEIISTDKLSEVKDDAEEDVLLDRDLSSEKTQPSIAQAPQGPVAYSARSAQAERKEKKRSKEVAGSVSSKANEEAEVSTGINRVIKGKVLEANVDSPLPGVNVVIKGTTIGTVTNAQGEYELQLNGRDATLVFSFIGLHELEVKVTDTDKLDVTMEPDVSALSEVVVTGYASADNVATDEYTYQLAEPVGGKKAFKKYLTTNMRYPQEAINNKIEGRVTIQFTITPGGSREDFSVLKGIGFGCDEELIRLIKEGPAWTPSKRNDVPISDTVKVRLKFSLPK